MMEDRFETTFIVEMAPDRTWKVLAEGERAGGRWWLPGFETEADVLRVDEGHEVHVRKTAQPCAGTEIMVTLEASESGTRVTVVQSGFGREFFEQALDGLTIGWSHIVADVALYLERGVRGGRHARPWAMLGCNVHETGTGLEVGAVWGGFAQRVGIEPGDVLLTIGGAPVVNRRELETCMRVFRAGEPLEATWAHERELATATAAL
jgi:hypothetical protein